MATEQEIIHSVKNAPTIDTKIRIIDQLGHKIKPHHRGLIRFLIELSRQENEPTLSYSAKRSLHLIRTRYNITNFPLFLMDPISLLQSNDPAYRIKALEIFDKKGFSPEQGYFILGSVYYEHDPFVLSRLVKLLPRLTRDLPPHKIEKLLAEFTNATDSRIKANALEALKELSGETNQLHLGILWQNLSDPHERVRNNCIQQLLENKPPDLAQKLTDILQGSENIHELDAALTIAQTLDSFGPEILKKATEKIQALEKTQANENTEPVSMLEETVEINEPQNILFCRLQKLRMLSFLPAGILSATICILLFSLYITKKTESHKWQTLYEQSTIAMQNQTQESEQTIAELREKSRLDVPIALRKIPLNDKTTLFSEHGNILKHNSQIFLNQAAELFESENYQEAIEIYKALYDVYKDNSLAVDAVRQLSRVQKVQNVLHSMADYAEKKQWISARKKLEEIKHLLSSDNYEKHLKQVEAQKLKEN